MKHDKRALVARLRAALEGDLAAAHARARDAADAATHEENRAESDKDMRSTESSYIARGHSRRVAELEGALAMLGAMSVRDLERAAPISVSALVTVADGGREATYFLVPAGGGVDLGGVTSLSTTSPLGAALLRAVEGDEITRGGRTLEIVAVG
ncbi:MAG: hypothetical protein IT374_08370 [Polyangiaceae bacterium]|nr:hypothetical protein [Polyangiaceae bacterium]